MREGGGGKGTYWKRGEGTKISVFVEAELQGPSKSEKKFQVRRGGQNGRGSENGWAGTHSQPIQYTKKKLFFKWVENFTLRTFLVKRE